MEKTAKLTKKDYFNTIINLLNGALDFGFDTDVDVNDVIAFCEKEIATLDKRSAKAKETAAAKKAEGDALTETIAAVLPAEFASIDEVVAIVNDPEITRAKVQYRLNQLAKAGTAEKGELTVNIDGKNKKIAAYRAVI